jgi:sec-independent protein translocase protein TatA
MGDGLFEGWHLIILLVVVLLLFGSRRLPGAAKSLGESMHIFKRSVSGLHDDDSSSAADPGGTPMTTALPPTAPIAAPVQDPTSQQLADLQRQVADLQRQNAGTNGGQASEAQSTPSL